ncbi:hypothetical protein BDV96DRAFT_462894, partial [Lophiotrema nucula]
LTLREAKVCEVLLENPHPSLAVYYGVQAGTKVSIKSFRSKSFGIERIIGLCFKKYRCTLGDLVKQRKHFDAETCLASIEAGIHHFHSLGYVHCDIKPSNIFYSADEGGQFVIGDFDSCIKIGHSGRWKCGTAGWSRMYVSYATPDIDFSSLEKIRIWLEAKGFGHPADGTRIDPEAKEINLWQDLKLNHSKWPHPPQPFNYNRVVPIYRPEWTIAAAPCSDRTFVKKPDFFKCAANLWEGEAPARIVEREIETCEILRCNPHPNIAEYQGVTHDEWDRITGVCFDRYPMDLHTFVNQGFVFDAKDVLQQIEAGIKHLHSMRFTHQDVKPANCLVDPTFPVKPRVVLGDFDSVHQIGEMLHTKWGTAGWNTSAEYADRNNDFYGLRLIEIWLDNKGGGKPEKGTAYPNTDDILK